MRKGNSGSRNGAVMIGGSGTLQQALALPPGTTVLYSDACEAWRAAKLVVIAPASVRAGGGLEMTVRYRKRASDANDSMELVNLPAGVLPLVADEAALLALEDLTAIKEVHPATVLHALDLRFQRGKLYTRVGDMMIAVRHRGHQSGAALPGSDHSEDPEAWYRARVAENTTAGDVSSNSEVVSSAATAPHVFEVAERCYAAATRRSVLGESHGGAGGDASSLRGTHQAIVVGGESGSGKTHAAKLVEDYLLFLGRRAEAAATERKGRSFTNGGSGGSNGHNVSGVGVDSGAVRAMHTVLHSFGHASSACHDDSSRFGRLTTLGLDRHGRIAGLRCDVLLLEALRATSHGPMERNFHVFYQLLGGATKAEKLRWHLDGVRPRELRYLRPHPTAVAAAAASAHADASSATATTSAAALHPNGLEPLSLAQGRYLRNDGKLDANAWPALRAALRRLELPRGEDLSEEEALAPAYDCGEAALRTCAGLLLLGQIAFEDQDETVPAHGSGTTTASAARCSAASARELHLCAALLGVSADALLSALTTRTLPASRCHSSENKSTSDNGDGNDNGSISDAASVLQIPRNAAESSEARDSLARAVYGNLFGFVLDAANRAVDGSHTSAEAVSSDSFGSANNESSNSVDSCANRSSISSGSSWFSHVLILDVLGFERLQVNSLEQLFGNYANEVLQHCFTESVFAKEQALYVQEGVPAWEQLEYPDNSLSLTLLEGPSKSLNFGGAELSNNLKSIEEKPEREELKGGVDAKGASFLGLLEDASRSLDDVNKDTNEEENEMASSAGPDRTLAATCLAKLESSGLVAAGSSSGSDAALKPNAGGLSIVVTHFAGPVSYRLDGFVEKNRTVTFHLPAKATAATAATKAAGTIRSSSGSGAGQADSEGESGSSSESDDDDEGGTSKDGTVTVGAAWPCFLPGLCKPSRHFWGRAEDRKDAGDNDNDVNENEGKSTSSALVKDRHDEVEPASPPAPLSHSVQKDVHQLRTMLKTLQGTATHYVRCLAPGDGPKGVSETKAAITGAAAAGAQVGRGKQIQGLGRSNAATVTAFTTAGTSNAGAASQELPMSFGFDRLRVAEQLESSGALAAVKMARCGYPVRWPLKTFASRYFPLAAAGAGIPKIHGARPTSLSADGAGAAPQQSGIVAYSVVFPDASLGFGVKFVRSGMPVVARITQAHLSCRLVAGHVLTHVASIDLADTKEATYADAKARGLDPAKEFQRAVALELRESPRPLKLSFAGPASDAPRLSCHVALAQFVEGLEPAHLSPQLQGPVLEALAGPGAAEAGAHGRSGGVLVALGVVVGTTQVLLRPEASALLDEALASLVDRAATTLQVCGVKLWLKKRRKRGAVALQRCVRGCQARVRFVELVAAAKVLKARIILERALRRFAKMRWVRAAVACQRRQRGAISRRAGRQCVAAAIRVQAWWRKVSHRKTLAHKRAELKEIAGLQAALAELRESLQKAQQQQIQQQIPHDPNAENSISSKAALKAARAGWDATRQQLAAEKEELKHELALASKQHAKTSAQLLKSAEKAAQDLRLSQAAAHRLEAKVAEAERRASEAESAARARRAAALARADAAWRGDVDGDHCGNGANDKSSLEYGEALEALRGQCQTLLEQQKKSSAQQALLTRTAARAERASAKEHARRMAADRRAAALMAEAQGAKEARVFADSEAAARAEAELQLAETAALNRKLADSLLGLEANGGSDGRKSKRDQASEENDPNPFADDDYNASEDSISKTTASATATTVSTLSHEVLSQEAASLDAEVRSLRSMAQALAEQLAEAREQASVAASAAQRTRKEERTRSVKRLENSNKRSGGSKKVGQPKRNVSVIAAPEDTRTEASPLTSAELTSAAGEEDVAPIPEVAATAATTVGAPKKRGSVYLRGSSVQGTRSSSMKQREAAWQARTQGGPHEGTASQGEEGKGDGSGGGSSGGDGVLNASFAAQLAGEMATSNNNDTTNGDVATISVEGAASESTLLDYTDGAVEAFDDEDEDNDVDTHEEDEEEFDTGEDCNEEVSAVEGASDMEEVLTSLRAELKAAEAAAEQERSIAVRSDSLRRRLSADLHGTTTALAEARKLLEPQRARETAAALAAGRVKTALVELDQQRKEFEVAQKQWHEQAGAREAAAAAEVAARTAAEARSNELESKVMSLVEELEVAHEEVRQSAHAFAVLRHEHAQALSNHESFANQHAAEAASDEGRNNSSGGGNGGSVGQLHASAAAAQAAAAKEEAAAQAAAAVAAEVAGLAESLDRALARASELEDDSVAQKKASANAVADLEHKLVVATQRQSQAEERASKLEDKLCSVADDLSTLKKERDAQLLVGVKRQEELYGRVQEMTVLETERDNAVASCEKAEQSLQDAVMELKQQKSLSYAAVSSLETRLAEATSALESVTQQHQEAAQGLEAARSQLAASESLAAERGEAASAAKTGWAEAAAKVEDLERAKIDLELALAEERRRLQTAYDGLKHAASEVETANAHAADAQQQLAGAQATSAEVEALRKKQQELEASLAAERERSAAAESELTRVAAFKATYGEHVARTQELELRSQELEERCAEQAKLLRDNPEEARLAAALAESERKEAAHSAALEEALGNISSMQERAASAQRRVWQAKVAKLTASLKDSQAAAAESAAEAAQLRQRVAELGGS